MIHVLHIDDEVDEFNLTKANLKRIAEDIKILHCVNPLSIDDFLESEQIDCIISDYQMPTQNGLDLLRSLREKNIDIPFIFFTGQGNEAIAADALRSGANDYFTKEDSFAQYERMAHSIRNNVEAYQNRKAKLHSEANLKKQVKSLVLAEEIANLGYFERNWKTGEGFWSEGFYRLLGEKPSQLEAKYDEFLKFIHPEDLEYVKSRIEKSISAKIPIEMDFRIKHKNGTILHIHGTADIIYDELSDTLISRGTFQDVSSLVNAEKERDQLDFLFRINQDKTKSGSFSFNFVSGKTYWTDQMFKLFGYKVGEVSPSMNLIEKHVHHLDLGAFKDSLNRLIADKEDFDLIFRFISKQGKEKFFRTTAFLINNTEKILYGSVIDVTENVKQQLDLLRHRASFLDSTNIGLIYYDINGKVIDLNNTARKLFSIKNDPDGHMNYKDVYSCAVEIDDTEINDEDLPLALIKTNPSLQKTKVFNYKIRNNSSIRLISVVASQESGKNEPEKFVEIVQDITEDQKSIDGLRSQLDQLLESHKKARMDLEKLDDELEKSRRLYELATVGGELGTWIWDIPRDKVQFNQRWAEIIGFDLDEVGTTVSSWAKRVHPDDHERAWQDIQDNLSGKSGMFESEHRLRCKDNSWVWILGKGKVIERDEKGNAILMAGTSLDITRQKEYEFKLRESEERLRNIVEHSTNLFYVHDVEHNLKYISPKTREFLDCEPEEALIRWTEFATDNPINEQGFEKTMVAIQKGKPQPPYELELVGVKGRIIQVEVHEAPIVKDGETVAIVGALMDITERKKSEQVLKESEHKFRKIMENIEMICVSLDIDGNITFANDFFLKMNQKTPRQVIGENWFTTYIPAEMQDHLSSEVFRKTLDSDGNMDFYLHHENEIVLSDNTRRTISWTNVVDRNQSGELVGVTSFGMDLTEHRNHVKVLEESHNKLAMQANELEYLNKELEAFTYSVSHDLKSPLRRISTYTGMLKENLSGTLDEESSRFLSKIDKSTAGMAELIEDLLQLAQVKKGKVSLSIINISKLAKEIIDDLTSADPEREKYIEIKKGIKISADKGLIKIVLENILSNAWKFTRNKKTTEIKISETDVEGRKVISIKDNGVGFEHEYAMKLFVPFSRLHDSREFKGNGIGLATVHRIITRHKGEVWIESAPGVGTTVFFTVEQCEEDN